MKDIDIKSNNKSLIHDINEQYKNKKLIKFLKNKNDNNYIIFEFRKSYNIKLIKIYPYIINNKPSLNNIKKINLFINE